MATLPLRLFDKTTGRVYQMGTLDGVDTTGMQDASPLPAGSGTAIELEVQYGDKAVPSFGVTAYGGGTNSSTAPGAPESVAATLSGDDVIVRVTAPQLIGTPPYRAIVVGLDGVSDPNPVVAPTGEGVFPGLPPGVYTPFAYAFGDGGIGPVTYGLAITIAGTGVPPVVTGLPTISGALKWASTLTLTLPTVTGAASSAIQWLSDGHVITGAASNTYKLGVAEFGTKISARVTYTAPDGSIASVTSLETAAVGKADMVALRAVPKITGSGEVGTTHTIDWGMGNPWGYSPQAPNVGGGGNTISFWLDGVIVQSSTRGLSADSLTWVPQLADIGRDAVARFEVKNNAYVNDKAFESPVVTVLAGASTGVTAVVDSAVDRGSMVSLVALGATAESIVSLTITARTDTALTGGVGVFELDQAGLDAWLVADYTTAAAHQVQASDIGPYAPGTPLQIGPFSALTKAIVLRPIGSGTYSYTLSFGSLGAGNVDYAITIDGAFITIDSHKVTIPPVVA